MAHRGRGLRDCARQGSAAALVICASLVACAASPAGGRADAPAPSASSKRAVHDARRAEVRLPGGRLFLAEIADTPQRWAEGYMFRREIADDDAMIFVFPEADVHPFWMKNTLVPLDMIWMDDAFSVLYVEPSAPPCRADPCPNYGPPRRARYVLEVKGGTAARERLVVGDRLKISIPQAAD